MKTTHANDRRVRFRNEVIWKRTSAHSDSRTLGGVHETVLVHSKGEQWTWNQQYVPRLGALRCPP